MGSTDRTNDGTIEDSPRGGYLIRFAQTYPTTPEDLWDAVTDAARISRWMAPLDGDLRLGGHWTAHFDDGSAFTAGTVTACDAPTSYTTTWQANGEDETTLVVRVEAVPDGAALRLEHDRVASRNYGAGWHTYLELLALEAAGDHDGIASFDWDARYAELTPRYRAA
ncbi:SRPBCC domain-containing protein [Curtobacterium sp. PhB115]|uniref:SRPBCC domain-containing protein n=1 Tax=Curtobacterium sp. PhB115 TaxID=2485173 RepID=UPI000FB568B4|nr:SRPBCC domain-containing protein [Curtobacterium sp. PhB115]ROP72355.1 uncharacterized protein YndB with AHSA1/START domain [Curtobacterium sp. PhB115]